MQLGPVSALCGSNFQKQKQKTKKNTVGMFDVLT